MRAGGRRVTAVPSGRWGNGEQRGPEDAPGQLRGSEQHGTHTISTSASQCSPQNPPEGFKSSHKNPNATNTAQSRLGVSWVELQWLHRPISGGCGPTRVRTRPHACPRCLRRGQGSAPGRGSERQGAVSPVLEFFFQTPSCLAKCYKNISV